MNTYLIVFKTKEGNSNGYAVVNACSTSQAKTILLNQGRYIPLGYLIMALKLLGNSRGCRSSDFIIEEGITSLGKSAYDIAVLNGFRGSEKKWLDLLGSHDPDLYKELLYLILVLIELSKKTTTEITEIKEVGEATQTTVATNVEDISLIKDLVLLLAGKSELTLTATPNTVYKNTPTEIHLKAVFNSTKPADFIGIFGTQTQVENTDLLETDITKIVTSTIDSITAMAVCDGLSFSATATISAVNPIYYGFDTLDLIKLPPVRTSTLVYSVTGYGKFILMIPGDILLPTYFTMNGAPFVVTQELTPYKGIFYTKYTSAYTYGTEDNNVTLNVEAKR